MICTFYCPVEIKVLSLSVTGCIMFHLCSPLRMPLAAAGHYTQDLAPYVKFCVNSSVQGSPQELCPSTLLRATEQQRIKTCVFPLSCSPQTRCPRHFLQATSPLCTDTQGLGTGTWPKIISYIVNKNLNCNLYWHWEQSPGCWCQSRSTKPAPRAQHHYNIYIFTATDAVMKNVGWSSVPSPESVLTPAGPDCRKVLWTTLCISTAASK